MPSSIDDFDGDHSFTIIWWTGDDATLSRSIENKILIVLSSGSFWKRKAFANRASTQFHFIAYDPLSKSVAIGAWPVSIFLNEWIIAWG